MSDISNKQCFSLGFIGGSLESAVGQTHQIASQMDGRWHLAAGCFSQIEKTNKATAQAWGVSAERCYENYQALIDNEKGKLDALVILTPTPSHTDIVISALNAGYAVICEKALSASSSDAQLIASVVKTNKQFLVVTLNYTGYPMLRELKEIIRSGKLGRIQKVHVEMPQEGFIRLDSNGKQPHPQSWRLNDGEVPTISLDLGVHLHHIIHYLTKAEPIELVADQSSDGWFEGVVDDVSCIVRYSDNIRCQMWYSKTAMGHRNGMKIQIYGSEGSASWFQMEPESLQLNYIDGRREILDRASNVELACLPRYNRFKAGHPAGFIEAFANLYCDIADCLSGHIEVGSFKSDEVFGVDHAIDGLKMFEAISKSVNERRWVSL